MNRSPQTILTALLLLLVAGLGCPDRSDSSPEARASAMIEDVSSSPAGKVGIRFASLLAAEDFDAAEEMLTPGLRAEMDAALLSERFREMIEYGDGPADLVEASTGMSKWPGRQNGDLGWVYVSISGPEFSEAVTLVVTEESRIRSVEWGRP